MRRAPPSLQTLHTGAGTPRLAALAGRLGTSIDDFHRLLMTAPTDKGFELTVIRGEGQRTVFVPAAA